MNKSSQENTTLKISLEKMYLFLDCPRCFYLDVALNLPRPSDQNPNLNIYIETLLKEEFDIHRVKDIAHPLMKTYNIDAEPMNPEKITEFRENLRLGMNCNIPGIDLTVSGKLDDLWVNPKGEIVVVDYHSVPLYHEFSFDMNSIIKQSRKIEIYQWLFRQNGFKTTSESYYIYCTGYSDKEAFDGKLEFDVKIIPYMGDDSWVEKTIKQISNTLRNSQPPTSEENCRYCNYRSLADDSKKKKPVTASQYVQREPEANKTTYELLIYEQDPNIMTLFGQAFEDETIIDSFDQEKSHQIFNYTISCVDSWETLLQQAKVKFFHSIIIDIASSPDFNEQLQKLENIDDLKSKMFILDSSNTLTPYMNNIMEMGIKNIYSYELFLKSLDYSQKQNKKDRVEDYLKFISRFVRHRLRSKTLDIEAQLQDLENYEGYKKLLLIEDDEFLVSLYRDLLNKEGYGVVAVSDGISAVEVVKEYQFDGIMCGIMMPWMNGLETIKILKEVMDEKKIPIWICSSIGQDSVIKDAYKLGIMGYFIKTLLTPEQVLSGINKIMGKY